MTGSSAPLDYSSSVAGSMAPIDDLDLGIEANKGNIETLSQEDFAPKATRKQHVVQRLVAAVAGIRLVVASTPG